MTTKGLRRVVAGEVAPHFNVHPSVAETRLVCDGICEVLGLKKTA